MKTKEKSKLGSEFDYIIFVVAWALLLTTLAIVTITTLY